MLALWVSTGLLTGASSTGAGAYTLAVSSRAFTLGLPANRLLYGRRLPVAVRNFTLARPANRLLYGRRLPVATRSFTLGRPGVTLRYSRVLPVGSRPIVLVTPDVGLIRSSGPISPPPADRIAITVLLPREAAVVDKGQRIVYASP